MILNKSSVDRGLCRGHIYQVTPSYNSPFPQPTHLPTHTSTNIFYPHTWMETILVQCAHIQMSSWKPLSFLLPSCNDTCLSIQLWDVWFKFFVLFHKFQIFTYGQLNFLLQTESIDLAERQEKSSQKVFARSNDNNMSSSIDSDGLPYIGQVCYMLRDCHLRCHFLFTGTDLIKIHCLYRW